jgi:hypothetical protein
MTALRSASLMPLQRPISSSVRQQPMHTPRTGSIWHTLMHGEVMGAFYRPD